MGKVCRRIAANRVFFIGTNKILKNYVLEFDVEGYVSTAYLLEEELCNTEWFGGLIIVAPCFPVREKDETFASFYERYSFFPVPDTARCRAYTVNEFDVFHMEFVNDCRIFEL